MKIEINKSAKRVLSITLALAMVIGTLFTANIGVNINANAADDGYVYDTWDGGNNTSFSGGTGVDGDPYIIETCEQLYAVTANKVTTDGVYFKVKDGVDAFYMQSEALKEGIDALTTAAEVKAFYEANAASCRIYWSNGTFQGNFDGNGAAVYGLYTDGSQSTFGLFHQINGGTIKNVSVMKSYANCSGFAGAIVGVSSWGTVYSTTIENCVVALNYINSTGTNGAIIGHAGNDPVTVKNCLVYGNEGSISQIIGYTDATTGNTVEDTVAIGVKPIIGNTCTYTDCYTDQSVSTSGVTVLPAESMKGVMAQVNMPGLDWATDSEDGFWYVSESGYPANIKPEGWTYVEAPDIWDGTAATEFAGGKGTKDDPYIIETASQLYKMVQDGGREVNGSKTYAKIYANTYVKDSDNKFIWEDRTNITVNTYRKCYYKVADGVTDIYLNPVVGGTLDTLKSLVNTGNALNWTKDFDANIYIADSDKDGIRDQATAFRGEFDGNGVTIHGLYSTAKNRTWNIEGVGFVPALMDDAVIKNVSFDKSYVYNNNYGMAAVITTSLGIDADNSVKDYDVDTEGNSEQMVNYTCAATANIGIHNVSVSNAYIGAKQSAYSNTDVAGFVATYATPATLSLTNCLFDGTNCEFVVAGTTPTYKAGIVSSPTSTTHIYLENCVSIDEYPIPTAATLYELKDCYTTETSRHSGVTQVTTFDKTTMPNLNWTQWSVVDGKPVVTGNSAAYNHATNWKEAIAYTNESRWNLNYSASSVGNWTMIGAHEDGVYINYENMQGSGTEDDPYLISDALTLARVIGSGGTNYTEKLYFKLTNDINVGGLRWIDQQDYALDEDGNGIPEDPKYSYRPFEGVLDGDGYAVTGLYANSSDSAGLIPVLAGGTVKNLHIIDAYVASDAFAGAIVGEINPDLAGTIENCSTDNVVTSFSDNSGAIGTLIGYHDEPGNDEYGKVVNCYSIDEEVLYFRNADDVANTGSGVVDEIKAQLSAGNTDYTSIWYIGGKDGSMPRLVNRAKAMPCADIDGDGEGYEYTTNDLTALKYKLLKKSGFENVYGDVSKNGKVNSSDLVILTRSIANDYDHIKDGFWRNVALGNIEIYYGENDNYDAARKLELYLESAVDVDIVKNASGSSTYVHENDGSATPGSQLAIVVGNVGTYTTSLTGNDYAVTYDDVNAVLWIQGANFTGVEQAVLDFIDGSDAATNKVYTIESATLSEEKQPKTIGGTTYYYAWGDEFDVATSDGSLTKDVWEYGEMGTEANDDEFSYSGKYGILNKDYSGSGYYKYHNLETANPDDLASLYEVKDGKLSIWRGIDENSYNATTHAWGYKPVTLNDNSTSAWNAGIDNEDIYASAGLIDTQRSLLFKQGYIEMSARLPNDGHAFPAFWFMGSPDGGQNRTYDASLYGKVYRYNNNWTGINAMNGAYPNSYKYQIPTCTLEFDIVELMQDVSYADEMGGNYWADERFTQKTGVYRTAFDLNIHKWYNENVHNDKLYVIDWDSNGNGGTIKGSYNLDAFVTSTPGSWIHRWQGEDYDFGNNATLAEEHIYGVAWTANEANDTFNVTVYVDGVEVMSMDQDTGYYENRENATFEENFNSKGGNVLNQYVFFVLDNHFYTYNQYLGLDKSNGTGQNIGGAFTDLEQQNDGENATFIIDYVRVYQEDGKRDIVTKETENFNNNNHFGYGK